VVVVKYLIDQNADQMLRNREGKMAKDYAYSKMDSKLVALLDRDNDQINI